MKEFQAGKKHSGKKIDRVLRDVFPNMPVNAMYKAFRKKDVKVNSLRIKEDYVVTDGDRIEVYITDDILFGRPVALQRGFDTVYEDNNIIIVNKMQGISIHSDRHEETNTLIDQVTAFLAEKGDYDPLSAAFAPSLCHRLDRNTGGLVLIAKNRDTLKTLLSKIRNGEVRKYYQCLVFGKMERDSDELNAYLVKDEHKARVFVGETKSPGSQRIVTRYRTLSYENGISRLEVELVTGRTHQIRAHMAYIGHPVVGDGKYGTNALNKDAGVRYQRLWAYKLRFEFKNTSPLDYLNRREYKVDPPF